jgi:hypothetical protein
MELSLDRSAYADNETWVKALRILDSSSTAIMSMQMRADEGSMRVRQFDRMSELMLTIAEQERKFGPLAPLELSPSEDPTS